MTTPRILLALAAASTLTLATATLADPDPKSPPTSPAVKPTKAPKPAKAKAEAVAVGSVAPEWEHKDRDGKTVKLSDLKGKVVLMDFWATWCPPCRAAMPGIEKLHQDYKDKGLVVLGMNSEQGDQSPGKDGKTLTGAEKAAAYMDKNKFTYGLIVDAEDAARKYKVTGIPAFFVIGHDGKVVFAGSGYSEEQEKKIHKAIDKAVAAMEAEKAKDKTKPAAETPKTTG